MADTSVPITPGTGVNVDGFTQANGDVRQAVVLGDASAASTQKVNPGGDAVVSLSSPGAAALGIFGTITSYGNQRVTMEPTSLFSDTFDSATGINTTDRWTLGGTVVPTAATGAAVVNSGLTASASSVINSKPTFQNMGLGFLVTGFFARFEVAATPGTGSIGTLNSHRFLGFGSAPTTWQAAYSGAAGGAGPLASGVGFEIDVDGFMYAVVYDNSIRTRIDVIGQAAGEKRLNLGRDLFDGRAHQFSVVMRSEMMFWYIDGNEAPVAQYTFRSATFSAPDNQWLPIRFHQINATTAPTVTSVLRVGAIGVGDTGRNSNAISDGTNPWRKAAVDAAGALAVNLSGTASNMPPVTGTIAALGSVTHTNVASAGNATIVMAGGVTSGATYVFEASLDGVNWFGIEATRSDGSGVDIVTPALTQAAGVVRAWNMTVTAATQLRIRNTAGTITTAPTIVISPGATLLDFSPTTRDFLSGGNSRTVFTAQVTGVALSATETLATLVPYRQGTAGTGAQALGITAGKTLRLQSMSLVVIGSATAAATAATARLRWVPTGTAAANSPIAEQMTVTLPAVASNRGGANVSFNADGFEIPSGGSFGVSIVGIASGTCDIQVKGYEFT